MPDHSPAEGAAGGTLLPQQRQALILARLEEGGCVLAAPLARELRTSEDTIRRDMRELAAAGLCRRVYGGVLPLEATPSSFSERRETRAEAKQALAMAASALVQSGQLIFLDAGSTNLAIARALPETSLTVVTNAPSIADVLFERGDIEVLTIGGRIDRRTGAALGAKAVADLLSYRPDLTFLGACTVAEDGIGAFDLEDAEFKRVLVQVSRTVAVAATADKLGAAAPHLVARPERVDTLIYETAAGAWSAAGYGRIIPVQG